MGRDVLWIGGWASGLACWRGDLEKLYPGLRHRFLDAHEILDREASLAGAMEELPETGVVAAWSLGSLLLHRAIAAGGVPDRRAVSLSPIFDFCGEGSPWPPSALRAMIRKLPRDRAGVLGEFWSLIRGSSPMSQEGEAAWRKQADRYSLDTLDAGLKSLGELKVDPASLASGRHVLVSSPADPLAPRLDGGHGMNSEAGAGNGRAYPSGHLPFLDYPEIIRPLLGTTP